MTAAAVRAGRGSQPSSGEDDAGSDQGGGSSGGLPGGPKVRAGRGLVAKQDMWMAPNFGRGPRTGADFGREADERRKWAASGAGFASR